MTHRSCTRQFFALGWIAVLTAVLLAPLAHADQPLPPPQTFSVTSPDGSVRLVVDAERKQTTAWRGDMQLWQLAGWYRAPFLANDGRHLVIAHGGLNLLPQDADYDTVILTFHRDGVVFATVPLGEMMDPASMQQTVSHLYWGHVAGLDADGHVVVETIENQILRFDPATAELVDRQLKY